MRDVLIRLEEKGLLKQARSAHDRRQRSAVITDCGRALLRELEPNVRRAHDILLRPLDSREKKVFLALLRRIVDDNNNLSRAPLPLSPVEQKERRERESNARPAPVRADAAAPGMARRRRAGRMPAREP